MYSVCVACSDKSVSDENIIRRVVPFDYNAHLGIFLKMYFRSSDNPAVKSAVLDKIFAFANREKTTISYRGEKWALMSL